MEKYEGFDKIVPAGEFERLEPGGYICKILKVTLVGKTYGECLEIAYDIAEGQRKGYFRRRWDADKASGNEKMKWHGMYYQTIIREADKIKYFKAFVTAVEKSNPGYAWDWNEKSLEGKLFGGVFGEEEFEAKDGSIKTSVKCRFVRSVDHVRNGVDIPEVKRLTVTPMGYAGTSNTLAPITEETDEVPF